MAELILASSSPYRRSLLERLRIPFDVAAPEVDETPESTEQPEPLARRLALAKAQAVSTEARWVVGSDQVAWHPKLGLIGKPGSLEANIRQLHALSGEDIHFFTALALLCSDGSTLEHLDRTVVRFRELSAAEIERYVTLEPATDCAGGCKVEGLGITLLDSVQSEDPTALIGLPLIALARLLRDSGCEV